MNIFISTPMSGLEIEDIASAINRAIGVITNREDIHKKFDFTSFKAQSGLTTIDAKYEATHENIWYLGRALTILANCEAAFFTKGWSKARGCIVELIVCTVYGIPCFFEDPKEYSPDMEYVEKLISENNK